MNKIFITLIIILGLGFFLFKQTKTMGNGPTVEASNQEVIIKGSDTEVQMVSNLAEEFSKDYPDSNISVTGGGSSVGIASLINGEIMIANSSRPLKTEELKLINSQGIDLKTAIIARDGLSVIVNKDNPIEELFLAQLGDIYTGKIANWSEVGGTNDAISLYGRQSTSGTYSFFRDVAVKDDYSPTMKGMEGNQAIIDGVLADQNGIGYVGVGYLIDENSSLRHNLKVIPLVSDLSKTAISPLDKDSVQAGLYPLFRPIYQFINGQPEAGSALDQFIKFELSEAGQEIVVMAGFYPITNQDEANNQQLQ